MCEPTTIAAVGSFFSAAAPYAAAASAAVGVASAVQQQRGQKAVAEANANLAEQKAQDALRRGQEARQEIQRRGMILEGQQRAALSSRGLDLAGGTPSDVLAGTDFFTASDAATAVTNSRREAWSNRAQRASFQAEADGISPGLTLLGGAGTVADKWYRNRPGTQDRWLSAIRGDGSYRDDVLYG